MPNGIVKSKINGNMAWLSFKSQTEQDTVISYCIFYQIGSKGKIVANNTKHILLTFNRSVMLKKKTKRKMQVLEGNLRKNSSSFLKERLICIMSFRDQANTISKALSSPCTINDLKWTP